mmetsp:Transcript_98218/g.305795  ORF Transcript_98218/g.305795 Transcript_98218/m.305795 type:complete len:230 (+) Transcript_98218:793-1482(+)
MLQEPPDEDGRHDVVVACELNDHGHVDILWPHVALLPEEVTTQQIHREQFPETEVSDDHLKRCLGGAVQNLVHYVCLHHQELSWVHQSCTDHRAGRHLHHPAHDDSPEGVADEMGPGVAVRRQHVLKLRHNLPGTRDGLPGRHGQEGELGDVEVRAVAPGEPVDEDVVRHESDAQAVHHDHRCLSWACDVLVGRHAASRLPVPITQSAHPLSAEAQPDHHLPRQKWTKN